MRIREKIVAAGLLSAAALVVPREAKAQAVQPFAPRDANWALVSNITTAIGAGVVTLMPRIYYNDPEATVGWKARWHVSVLVPALTVTALTLMMEGPIKGAIKDPRPGCTADQTALFLPGSGCESYGMVSTQSFGAWGATGVGTGIFLIDTLKYSNAKFHAGSFVGNVAVPLVLSVVTSVARSAQPGINFPEESVPQIVVGSLTGFATGALAGIGYALMRRPNCGYGNNLICW